MLSLSCVRTVVRKNMAKSQWNKGLGAAGRIFSLLGGDDICQLTKKNTTVIFLINCQ